MKTPLRYFLLLLLLFPFLLKAQSNFKEGYVVTVQGDTVKGFIDFREWNQTPKSFTFKTTTNARTTQDFTPANARYVNIQNLEAYQLYTGPITQDQVLLAKLSTGIDTSTINTTIFLKVILSGKNVTLYAYRDPIKTRFFLKTHDQDKPIELIYRIYYKIQDAQEQSAKPEFITKSKLYIGHLWFAAGKYQVATPEFKRRLDLISYAEPDIIKIINLINGVGKEKGNGQKSNVSRTSFFAGVGINRATVKSTGRNEMNEHYTWDTSNGINRRTYTDRQEVSQAPKVNAGIDYTPFPNTQKFLLRGELTLTTTNFTFQNTHNLKFPDRDLLYTFTLKQVIISLAPQLIYNLYNNNRFKVYLGGGVAYNQCFYPENRLHIKPLDPGTGSDKEGIYSNYRPYDKHWINFPFRAGLVINKKFDLSAIYWSPSVLVNGNDLYTTTKFVHLGLNYNFK